MYSPFIDLLRDDHVVVFDGAMGTMLYAKGVPLNHCYDELCLSNPALVRDIHAQYVRAGAQVIETNTFGANRYKLASHELADKVTQINTRAVEIARAEARTGVLVAGAIGPLGLKIEPWGPTSVEEAREAFREQAQALAQAGVDLFVLETFSDLNEIHQALRAVRDVADLPVIAQMTVQEDCTSLYGTTPEVFTQRLDAWGADAIGINCSVGPLVMLQTLERMVGHTQRPLSVQPNAGIPRNVEGRNIYLASPEYMAEYARRFILTGARIVGGCCGTTPAHIRAIANAVRALRPRRAHVIVHEPPKAEGEPPSAAIPREAKSPFAAKLASGEFVTCVELVPPRGHGVARVLERARKLKQAGIDAVNIPDGPRASARMSPLALAVLLEREAGVETILHYACRDRNLVGMQSDLIGAFALGLRNLLLVTGDPPKLGDYPDATAVFDVDSIGLTNMVKRLNEGLDLGGNSIGHPTAFHIGVGVNPGAVDLDYELRRFAYKVEAGAEFAITQPIYDPRLLEGFLRRIEGFDIDLIVGIWPLVSLRNAEFIAHEVLGTKVPPIVLERMARAEEAGGASEEGVAIAREVLAQVRPMVQGVQVAAPFGRIDCALAVLGKALDALES